MLDPVYQWVGAAKSGPHQARRSNQDRLVPLALQGGDQFLDMNSLAIARGNAVVEEDPHCLEDLPALGPVAREVANHDMAILAR